MKAVLSSLGMFWKQFLSVEMFWKLSKNSPLLEPFTAFRTPSHQQRVSTAAPLQRLHLSKQNASHPLSTEINAKRIWKCWKVWIQPNKLNLIHPPPSWAQGLTMEKIQLDEIERHFYLSISCWKLGTIKFFMIRRRGVSGGEVWQIWIGGVHKYGLLVHGNLKRLLFAARSEEDEYLL